MIEGALSFATVPALLADSVCLSPDLLKLISEHFAEPCNSAQVCSQWTRAVLNNDLAVARVALDIPEQPHWQATVGRHLEGGAECIADFGDPLVTYLGPLVSHLAVIQQP